MLNGLTSKQDAWADCVKIILGVLEDSLLQGAIPTVKPRFNNNKDDNKDWYKDNGSIGTLSAPESPSAYSVKRKRDFPEMTQDRKLQRMSSSLANDIARSLSVSMDDVDMTSVDISSTNILHPLTVYNKPSNDKENLMPTLRRISLSGTLNPSTSTIDQWLVIQAQRHQMSLNEFRNAFVEKQKVLRDYLEMLQMPDQPFNLLRDSLSKVLHLANELSGDHTLSFNEIFPEWTLYENRINKLVTYVQSIEDMSHSVNSTISQTDDLLEDIKGLQNLLDTKVSLYGDSLVQNGLGWKAMGLPVDDYLLNATKEWIYNLCVGLLDALNMECEKAQGIVTSMADLIRLPAGESLMASILAGLEFIAEASTFIGFTSDKLVFDCGVLLTIYEHWISKNIEHAGNKPVSNKTVNDKKKEKSSVALKRANIRYMQLINDATRALSSLVTLSEMHIINRETDQDLNTMAYIEDLASSLVELTVCAVSVIEMDREKATPNAKVSGNIMANTQTVFIHMAETLLVFSEKVIQLAGRDWIEGRRIQVLRSYLEDLETSHELGS